MPPWHVACMHAHMCKHMYACTHARVCTHAHTHMHTHTHTHTQHTHTQITPTTHPPWKVVGVHLWPGTGTWGVDPEGCLGNVALVTQGQSLWSVHSLAQASASPTPPGCAPAEVCRSVQRPPGSGRLPAAFLGFPASCWGRAKHCVQPSPPPPGPALSPPAPPARHTGQCSMLSLPQSPVSAWGQTQWCPLIKRRTLILAWLTPVHRKC